MTISATVSQSTLDFQLTHEIDENGDGRLFRFGGGKKEEKELILKGKKKKKKEGFVVQRTEGLRLSLSVLGRCRGRPASAPETPQDPNRRARRSHHPLIFPGFRDCCLQAGNGFTVIAPIESIS